jgi:hypothetical protein
VTVETVRAQRHAPPAEWDARTFETLTDALAAALVAAYRRGERLEVEERAA